MRKIVWITLIIFSLLIGTVAASTDENYAAAAQVSVTDVQINPAVLIKGDTATVAVTVKNTGDDSVAISRATLSGTGIAVLNSQTYDTVGDIGASTTKTFTFTIRADGSDGFYYPTFTLDFRNAGSLRSPVPVQVQSNEVEISVLNKPEVFTADKKETVKLLIGNSRENAVSSVTVTPSGDGIESTQSSSFIGNISPDGSAEVTFDIAASHSTDLVLTVTYRNGINTHTTVLSVPIDVGTSLTDPILVVNNLKMSASGGTYDLTGDVTNAGLEDAMSVIVTAGSPAKATDPYPNYVIGSLDSDDFSSFEVTFTGQGLISVPILVQYKDEDGNDYTTTYTYEMSTGMATASGDSSSVSASSGSPSSGGAPGGGGPGGMSMFGMGGGGRSGSLPLTQIGILIVVLIVGVVAWRKGYLGRARTALKNRVKKE
ncbi:COG1361 S-layer family protein [Methanofollis ethanolicus]|uniref:COG1361 S-layer family protein n=1 Tax=Methanofollis ethanolicus TaxID=488124 RepID=UPI000830950B|nr:hypothetical protein [Methanofollis ethanolicus]